MRMAPNLFERSALYDIPKVTLPHIKDVFISLIMRVKCLCLILYLVAEKMVCINRTEAHDGKE